MYAAGIISISHGNASAIKAITVIPTVPATIMNFSICLLYFDFRSLFRNVGGENKSALILNTITYCENILQYQHNYVILVLSAEN